MTESSDPRGSNDTHKSIAMRIANVRAVLELD
jgi:hypothetical protein